VTSIPIVVDASFAAAWVLPDEGGPAIDAVLRQVHADGARVPSLFWHEMRNLVAMAERRGRLGHGEAEISILQLRQLPIEDAGPGGDSSVLSLALRHRLTAYDASYLALAAGEKRSLATLDNALAAAARTEGVTVVGPLA
jgi:predicted nucleic acid-binding protein